MIGPWENKYVISTLKFMPGTNMTFLGSLPESASTSPKCDFAELSPAYSY